MDQALEKCLGIIGVTRQKESVAKWNLIKHEKSKFTKFLDGICGVDQADEYSLHHEFSETVTKKDQEDVEAMKEFVSSRCDLMKVGKLSILISGIQLPDKESDSLLNYFETGEVLYKEYRQFDTIHKVTIAKTKKMKNLSGCHIDSKDTRYKLVNGELIDIPSLKCSYDEADDRIMYHLNHAVRTDHFTCAHVVSGDTDILVSLMYHYLSWSKEGLQEIWMHHVGNRLSLKERENTR